MRNRFCNIAVYFLLTCLIFEHAVPFFMVQTRIIEVFHSKGDVEDKDAKSSSDDLISFHEGPALPEVLDVDLMIHPGSLFSDSEEIPDSAHRSIFSPPPNRA